MKLIGPEMANLKNGREKERDNGGEKEGERQGMMEGIEWSRGD